LIKIILSFLIEKLLFFVETSIFLKEINLFCLNFNPLISILLFSSEKFIFLIVKLSFFFSISKNKLAMVFVGF